MVYKVIHTEKHTGKAHMKFYTKLFIEWGSVSDSRTTALLAEILAPCYGYVLGRGFSEVSQSFVGPCSLLTQKTYHAESYIGYLLVWRLQVVSFYDW